MTTTPHGLPDGEVFAISDTTILVDSVESVAAAGFIFGQEERTLQVHVTATGRRPRTQDPADVTLAMSIEGAHQLLDVLLHTLEVVAGVKDTDFLGRPIAPEQDPR